MDNSRFEATRDEYVGFLGEINKSMMNIEQYQEADMTIIKVISKATGIHLCTRIIPKEGQEHYFIFNMPEDNERVMPKPVMKITLDSKEEVQNFFNALSKLSKEGKDGGTV